MTEQNDHISETSVYVRKEDKAKLRRLRKNFAGDPSLRDVIATLIAESMGDS